MSDANWVCDRRLCLTEDRSRVVEESDPDARWLWAIPGRVVPMSEAMRLGAVQHDDEAEADGNEGTDEAPAKPATRTRKRN